MKVLYHVQAWGSDNYTKYACICCDSLIRNADIKPDQIHVWVERKSGEYFDTLKRMGCTLIPQVVGKSKIGMIESLMHSEQADTVMLLDSDIIVQPSVSFPAVIRQHKDSYIAVHENQEGFMDVYDRRTSTAFGRIHPLLQQMFGVPQNNMVAPNIGSRWTWGSFYLVNKRVRDTRFWQVAVFSNEFGCWCDETVCRYAEIVDPGKLSVVKEFGQVVASNLATQMSMSNVLLHYCGPNNKESQAEFLEGLYRDIVRRLARPTTITKQFL